jgi:hypothetical protein
VKQETLLAYAKARTVLEKPVGDPLNHPQAGMGMKLAVEPITTSASREVIPEVKARFLVSAQPSFERPIMIDGEHRAAGRAPLTVGGCTREEPKSDGACC